MNTLKKFLNWFTNNDLRQDVELLEEIIYSECEWSGLREDVSDLENVVKRLRMTIMELEIKVEALTPNNKTKTKTAKRVKTSKK